MFYKLTIDFQKMMDDIILPRDAEKNVLFYELVIKNDMNVIMRTPFIFTDHLWKIELYDEETHIDVDRLKLSMKPHIARFNKSSSIFFHVSKLIHDIDDDNSVIRRIGYVTNIKEFTSEIQDIPVFELNETIDNDNIPYFYVIDLNGKIVEVVSGKYTEGKMDKIQEAID